MGASSKAIKEEKHRQNYVIDASALYPMLLQTDSTSMSRLLPELTILDLTKYEIGNAARFDRKVKDAPHLMELWKEVLSSMREVQITDLQAVQKIALENKITFYDAAYIQVALELKSKLVTCDREILDKFRNITLDPKGIVTISESVRNFANLASRYIFISHIF